MKKVLKHGLKVICQNSGSYRMDVHLIDIDLEQTPPKKEEIEQRIFGYNRIDMIMLLFCIILGLLLVGFLIWFLMEHSK